MTNCSKFTTSGRIYNQTDVLLAYQSKLRMNKQMKPAFKLFIDFSLTHYEHGKNAFLLRRRKSTPGSAAVDEHTVLCLGKLGFPAAAPCRNKH